MEAELVFRARSSAAATTEELGERLGLGLGPGALVALVGELGSGKTTLVRGLARGLGVQGVVSSPTFTRMRALEGRVPLYHFDAWRGGAPELFEEGAEFLAGEGVAVVEWAERVDAALPRPRILLRLSHRAPDQREIEACLVPSSGAEGPATAALGRSLRLALERARTTPGLDLLGGP